MEVVVKAQGQIDHFLSLGDDLGTTTATRKEVANIAIVLLDGEGQVFAGEQLL